MLGSWNVNVSVGSMPQKIATAVGKLNDMVGCEYNPIAYLGSQVVNGTNHAVLAEQLVVTGKDTKNIVVVIFHEAGDEVSVVNIERVVIGGAELGGKKIAVETEIAGDAKAALDEKLAGYLGVTVKPFALLATQVVKGTDYIFAAEVAPVVPEPVKTVALVTVNQLADGIGFTDILK